MSVFSPVDGASYGARAAGLRVAAVFMLAVAVVPAAQAQRVAGLAQARQQAERVHLWRVGVWGAANVVAGTALFASSGAEAHAGRRAFGIQSAAWGAVNVGIAAVALSKGAEPTDAVTLAQALRAENSLGDVLWLNAGLDAGYVAVGATLWIVASRGVSNASAWRGHGQAVVLQGAALLALDAVVLAGSNGRLGALIDLSQTAALVPTGTGLALVVGL